jgi:hypothetical protein
VDNENAIFWPGIKVPIGIEVNGRIHWFANAPREAIEVWG